MRRSPSGALAAPSSGTRFYEGQGRAPLVRCGRGRYGCMPCLTMAAGGCCVRVGAGTPVPINQHLCDLRAPLGG